MEEKLRRLPSVDHLIEMLADAGLSRPELATIARRAVDEARARILDGGDADPEPIANSLVSQSLGRKSQRVVNATGVILHTNLGRAPLSQSALEAATTASAGYSNAELDLSTGERGSRGESTRSLLAILTGAEDALVVNNNAAAVLLALSALATGRFVPVSRGELIEIGGSYRLPDVMAASGAKLVEVGTTNKTKPADYELAIQLHNCAILLKVHRANFEVSGFTASTDLADLVTIGRASGVPVVYDIGSGLLDDTTPWLSARASWLDGEPGIAQAIAVGADLVMFSGDKILGGPQAGIIVGRSDLVAKLRDHPLRRALRIDASTDAALETTLRSYLDGEANDLPFWNMANQPYDALEARAAVIADSAKGVVEDGASLVGAGSAPSARIATPLVRIANRQDLYEELLTCKPPILARRDRGDLIIDVRTVDPSDDQHLLESISRCL